MSHKESDKIPSDIWIDSNDPNVKPGLTRYFGQNRFEDLLDYLDIDIYRFKPNVSKSADFNESIAKFFLPAPDERFLSLSPESMSRPFADAEDPAELDKFAWPSGDIFDYSNIEAILESQKHRVLWAQAGTWSPIFCKLCELCGMEKVLIDMIVNPEFVHALIGKILAFYKDSFRRTLEASKGRLDVFGFGDDFATQQGLMFSQDLWRQFFKEPMKELVDLIKSYGVYVAFHSCGAIRDIIPDFLKIGVDILFPIQPKATGMEAATLKRDFGKDIVFYGGIDVQQILPFGSEADVRIEVSRVSKILSKDGGYIIASSHGIMKDVPPANEFAMYDEIKQHYSIGY
jgi:uroporphyrinogen decarboxylase